MINKKKLWFLTLFSLILVLSIYYVTMPEELLLTNSNTANEEENVDVAIEVEESDILVALRVEADKQLMKEMEDLQIILTDVNSSVDEKNKAFDDMKELNSIRGVEEELEKKVKQNLNLESFVKVNNNQVRVVIKSDKHDSALANQVMRLIQEEFDKKMTISVKFQNS